MDVFSHGIWSALAAKAANKKIKKPLNVWLAAFWGIFPDIFAFTIPFIWLFWNLALGNMNFSDFPRPEESEPPTEVKFPIFNLASLLYNFSHSLIVFILIFALFWLIKRRLVLELSAWFFHILIDIPTHSYKFYPTPFLWPVSDFKFDGFLWSEPWFMILNYSALAVVFILLRKKYKEDKVRLTKINT